MFLNWACEKRNVGVDSTTTGLELRFGSGSDGGEKMLDFLFPEIKACVALQLKGAVVNGKDGQCC